MNEMPNLENLPTTFDLKYDYILRMDIPDGAMLSEVVRFWWSIVHKARDMFDKDDYRSYDKDPDWPALSAMGSVHWRSMVLTFRTSPGVCAAFLDFVTSMCDAHNFPKKNFYFTMAAWTNLDPQNPETLARSRMSLVSPITSI